MRKRITLVLLTFLVPALIWAANSKSLDLESGSSQYAGRADSASLDLSGNFTIELWIRGESFATGENNLVSKYDDPSNQRAYRVRLTDSGTNLYVAISSNGSTAAEDFVAVNLSTGVWYHLAVVYTASTGVVEYYKNGVSLGTKSGFPTSIHNSNADFQVGAKTYNNGGYFDGLIDDVRVWSAVRTAAQITENYKKELTGTESNLQGYWKLNGDYEDATSNNNDLTASGTPIFSDDLPFSGLLEIRKPSDESVTSSTTLQDDDDLIVDLDTANATYFIEGLILASSSSDVPDIKIAFTVPSGATMDIAYISSRGSTFNHGELLETSGTASITIPIDNANVTVIMVRGTVKLGSTTGTLKLQWAQATSSATATTVKEGSFLHGTKR